MIQIEKLEAEIASFYEKKEFPALLGFAEKWKKTKPLSSLKILAAAPIFRNTIAQHLALIAAGAELSVGIGKNAQFDKRAVEILENANVKIVRAERGNVPEFDVILDNAGYFAAENPKIGFAELTRSGVEKYKKSSKPVFLADAGKIKRIETYFGTGESFIRAMKALGNDKWRGKKLVVAGSGKVGSGIIFYGKKFGAEIVCITDPETISQKTRERISEIVDFRDDEAIISAAKNAFAIVTATGTKNALARKKVAKALVESPAILANMGVEDEYGSDVPEARVLEKKRSLNFFLNDPTHMNYIEGTLSLHAAGAVFLAENAGTLPPGIFAPPKEIEDEILDFTRKNGCISEEIENLE